MIPPYTSSMERARRIQTIEVVDWQMAGLFAAMTPAQRIDLAGECQEFARAVAEKQVRKEQPGLDDRNVQREVVWRMLGIRL